MDILYSLEKTTHKYNFRTVGLSFLEISFQICGVEHKSKSDGRFS